MTVAPPSPKTTLVILLGASEWPFSPEFQASQAFLNSAMELRAYFFNSSQFRLPAENLLNLFNSNQSSDDMDGEIGRFLERRMGEMNSQENRQEISWSILLVMGISRKRFRFLSRYSPYPNRQPKRFWYTSDFACIYPEGEGTLSSAS